MNRYEELVWKAPIIDVDEKVVHLSDFVNDIRLNTDKNFNKKSALDDLELLFKYISDSRKNDQILYILKEKEVAIDELKNCIKNDSEDRPALEEYNAFAGDENSLTQEEFDLLKGWLKL